FQAEDGIRDLIVTGVQTCALPILTKSALIWAANALASASWPRYCKFTRAFESLCNPAKRIFRCSGLIRRGSASRFLRYSPRWRRSEERRVGKEGRSRAADAL